MSQNVKVISHLNYGAPVIKGDNWGYMVNMLRQCLINGFNERTDISELKVIDENTVTITFLTPHNYQIEQTIAITGAPLADLNTDFIIRSINGLIITCDTYIPLSNIIGQELLALSGVSSKVSPLGFIEEYSLNNKSVFRPNEVDKNCYLCVDDDMPTGWDNTKNILPLVFMTDKMSDINTVIGKFIVPYDSTTPNRYKEKIYGSTKTGMWHWPSFFLIGNLTNTVAQQGQIVEWSIVGNDKFFYIIARFQSYYEITTRCFYFGKFKSLIPNDTGNYILLADSYIGTNDLLIAYNGNSGIGPTNSTLMYNKLSYNNVNNMTPSAILKDSFNRKPIQPILLPIVSAQIKSNIFVSGIANNLSNNTVLLQYPEKYTNKFKLSKVQIAENTYIRGIMPGLLWQQTLGPYMNMTITRHKYNNKLVRLFQFTVTSMFIDMSSTSVNASYSISLSNDDWSL